MSELGHEWTGALHHAAKQTVVRRGVFRVDTRIPRGGAPSAQLAPGSPSAASGALCVAGTESSHNVVVVEPSFLSARVALIVAPR